MKMQLSSAIKLFSVQSIFLSLILAVVCNPVFGQQVVAQPMPDDLKPYLKDYNVPTAKLRAGFIPYKAQLVWGEPLQVKFTVENLGTNDFKFTFGGDYRGTGRHDRFKITVTDANGKALPDPIEHPFDFGGFLQSVNLKTGQIFTNVIDLTSFRIIDKPGIYTVNCRFAFDERWSQKETTNPVVNSIFTLTILERTPERVSKVLDELVVIAQSVQGQDLDETLALIARFGRDDAVPRLAQLAKSGTMDRRSGALGALSLIPTDDSLDIVLTGLKDSDPKIRAAAAGSLGAIQKPRAVDALLGALPREKSPVAEAIVLALGTSKSDRAFPVITNTLDAGQIELQRAAVNALVNFGGSNAIAALTHCINTNYLSLRYEIVLALAEKLHQPIQAEWLLPVLMSREYNTHEWYDSLRLLQMYVGEKAIPTMLSCLDFDVAWSGRNYQILYEVKLCPNAPHFEYNYEFSFPGSDSPNYPDGTPEMWTNNLHALQALKALAGPISIAPPRPQPPSVPYLTTDPPIDFTPTFKTTEDGGVEIKSGFLDVTIYHQSESFPYSPSDPYKLVYHEAARFRSLPNASDETRAKLNITPQQMNQIATQLNRFAEKLCGSQSSNSRIANYYNLLVNDGDYCTGCDEWNSLFSDYREAPASLKEQTKADLIDSVRVFSQNYHSGTVEFAEAAKKIFTAAQLEEILR
jgi:hypothetical protein